jgi:hypothetical protein
MIKRWIEQTLGAIWQVVTFKRGNEYMESMHRRRHLPKTGKERARQQATEMEMKQKLILTLIKMQMF